MKISDNLLKKQQVKNEIFPCLWFDGQAKAAAEYYCSVFRNSKIIEETPMAVTFELNGQKFMGLNGGAHFKFNEAVSFVINCDTQDEIDYYWERLKAGGQESMCGWLKDKFGVSWQVVPTIITQLLSDPARAERITKAFMDMRKLDIEKLKQA